MADERTLTFLRELEREDEAVAARLAALDELARETESVRARAADLDSFLSRLPGERDRVSATIDEAHHEHESRRDELARAAAELAEAERRDDAERLAAARRAEVRARDLVRMVERRLAGAEAERERLDSDAEAAARESETLRERARGLAAALRADPGLAEGAAEEPGASLDDIARWATNARAALFVARGRLAIERESIIRQANELGAALLGEPLAAQSAALVARRVEQAGSG